MPAKWPEACEVRALPTVGGEFEFWTPVRGKLQFIRDGTETCEDRLIEIGLRAERAEFVESFERVLLVALAPEDVGEIRERTGRLRGGRAGASRAG